MKLLKLCKIAFLFSTGFFVFVHLINCVCLPDLDPDLELDLHKQELSENFISGNISNYKSICSVFGFSQSIRNNLPILNLAVTACAGRFQEALTLLKSAIIFGRDVKLNIILFVDGRSKLYLPKQLQMLQKSARNLNVAFHYKMYESWFPPDEERLWRKMFARCSTQRLFFPSLLPNLVSLIYMDSDTLFLSNVKDLWLNFENMKARNQMAAMAAEHELSGDGWYNLHAQIPFYGQRGLNAGIMLMNLTKFRERKMEDVLRFIYRKYKHKLAWADQDLLNIYFHFYPESVYELSCDFNYRTQHCDCQYRGDCSCKPAIQNGISILHGNRRMFHSSSDKHKFAKSIYKAFKQYDLDKDQPHKLLQQLEKDLEYLKEHNNKSQCARLESKNIFRKFRLYLESAK